MFETLHGVKKGIKDIVAPQGMFEDLGLKYYGPVDGHDEQAVEKALRQAKEFGGPVIVHVITQKGRGYQPALDDDADHMHGIGKINPETGLPFEVSGRIWTDEFNEEMVRIGAERPDVVAITAAMLIPVGLDGFAAAYPERVFDVGIAEQHAVTMASGLAFAGLHPVVAVYATFLNRAFDQVLMDCALHRAGVTFILDRAGVTGSDGPSHNGMWDMTLTSIVPGLRLAAPRDGEQVKLQLREALDVSDAPTVLRFPKGDVAEPVAAVRSVDGIDVLHETGDGEVEVLVVGVGAFAGMSVEVGEKLAAQGHTARVVDPRWVLPVSPALVELARSAGAVAVVEDNLASGGIGSAVTFALREAGIDVPVHTFGIPKRFLAHASRPQLLEELGLTADRVVAGLAPRLTQR
jgi:1-deoxy-D-xylulose-5-phosphate synthase